MSKVSVGDKEIIFEESVDDLKPSKFPKAPQSVMTLWLVKKKIAKNDFQAKLLLVVLSILIFSASIIIFYFGSLYASPQNSVISK